ncbi:cell division protein FtsA [Psychrobacter sp. HD31]|uniref:cell division protein FtsA n=1 Tax=Psychrobacter sp. HD31 TaxID=3112003 RepID=UPI003DA6ACE0
MSNPENLVVVHLSATAVYAVIGQIHAPDDIRILGLTEVKTNDFYQGRIIDHDRLKASIKQAIQEVEDMANCRVHSVWLSLSTPELLSKNSSGTVNLGEDPISVKDIVEALGQAKARDLPHDYYLMHHMQQGVYINNESMAVDNPIGTYADMMTVMYHLMMLPVVGCRNIEDLFRPTNVRIDHMIFDAISSSEYGLISDEKEQGICFIDIGASTTSVCVYKDNKLIFTSCLPHGSNQVTMDISAHLGLSMIEAENIKKRNGTVDMLSIDPAKFINVSRDGAEDLTVNMHELTLIIEARYREIYKEVFIELDNANLLNFIKRGVVLSGGGSMIKGMVSFSKRFLEVNVMLANTNDAINVVDNIDDEKFQQINALMKQPGFRTAFGTLLYSQSEDFRHNEHSSPDALYKNSKANGFNSALKRLNEFLKQWL